MRLTKSGAPRRPGGHSAQAPAGSSPAAHTAVKSSHGGTFMAKAPRSRELIASKAVAARGRRLPLTPVAAAVLSALYGSAAPAADEAPASGSGALQEIVVTATRRSESAQNVPISITAISGRTLEQAGVADKVDLGHFLAGVNVTDKGAFGGVNGSTLIIRGLNSDSTSGEFIQSSPIVQPVATYVDDTPVFFNLRLQDLERVEILRGPQGTLYGSGSLGGTIRFVQNAPDPR